MHYEYRPKGVCSTRILLELDGDTIENVQFVGGCGGNAQGISALVKGKNADEVIGSLRGIRCGRRDTSCPDQLAKALQQAKKSESEQSKQDD